MIGIWIWNAATNTRRTCFGFSHLIISNTSSRNVSSHHWKLFTLVSGRHLEQDIEEENTPGGKNQLGKNEDGVALVVAWHHEHWALSSAWRVPCIVPRAPSGTTMRVVVLMITACLISYILSNLFDSTAFVLLKVSNLNICLNILLLNQSPTSQITMWSHDAIPTSM